MQSESHLIFDLCRFESHLVQCTAMATRHTSRIRAIAALIPTIIATVMRKIRQSYYKQANQNIILIMSIED